MSRWSVSGALAALLLALVGLLPTAAHATGIGPPGPGESVTTHSSAWYDNPANLAVVVAAVADQSGSADRRVVAASGSLFAFSGELSAPRQLDEAVGAFCSFTATTAVLMADGTTKALEDMEVGDRVLAEDPETGERGPRRVTHVWIHQDEVTDLVVDGQVVTTTEDHPFWNATDAEWQRADTLDRGDFLLAADGGLLAVDGLDDASVRTTTAYNLTVEGVHTYFVIAGHDKVLVHNTCDIPGNPFRGADAPQRSFDHLEEFSGLDPHVASNRLHAIKQHFGIGAADNVVIGRTGDVYNPQTGDWLGTLTDSGWGR